MSARREKHNVNLPPLLQRVVVFERPSRYEEQASRENQEVVALRRHIEELRAEVDASRLRELDSKGMIENLREEVDRYQEQMRHTVAPIEENEDMVDYQRLKKRIIQEKQEMAETNQQLKKHLAEMYEQQEEMHRKNSEANLQVQHVNSGQIMQSRTVPTNETPVCLQVMNLSEKLQHASQEVHREQRLKEKMEEELECMAVERNEQAAKEAELTMTVGSAFLNRFSLSERRTTLCCSSRFARGTRRRRHCSRPPRSSAASTTSWSGRTTRWRRSCRSSAGSTTGCTPSSRR